MLMAAAAQQASPWWQTNLLAILGLAVAVGSLLTLWGQATSSRGQAKALAEILKALEAGTPSYSAVKRLLDDRGLYIVAKSMCPWYGLRISLACAGLILSVVFYVVSIVRTDELGIWLWGVLALALYFASLFLATDWLFLRRWSIAAIWAALAGRPFPVKLGSDFDAPVPALSKRRAAIITKALDGIGFVPRERPVRVRARFASRTTLRRMWTKPRG
ncbi:hypothetical protein HII28_18015 [Planctomonas sp. JC2975]|uniref:hypothetical protein n=1 Tax=Planctomonas sp. JC2975 TaxID=2729626 RepID=UPI00147333F0|nr:hypothetical protein [Planctomonas sp. JC2975]NNC13764.1 hypothetical protein [Planctomonas sp. JC2975]